MLPVFMNFSACGKILFYARCGAKGFFDTLLGRTALGCPPYFFLQFCKLAHECMTGTRATDIIKQNHAAGEALK